MFYYEREKTSSTPYILVDEEKAYMKFSGESFPENVIKCYGEVSSWLTRYLETSFGTFTFDFEMIYFNSSTSKVLTSIFSMLNDAGKNNRVIVNWCCSEDNDIMIEYGEEFKKDNENIEMNIILD